MKTNFKKFALGTVALGASVLLLAGCGNSKVFNSIGGGI